MESTLAKTPLHDWHAAHGGRMVDFAGWSMPVQYSSIVTEHTATRNAVGLFDVSHMGRLRFFGPNVADFLDSVVTRRVTDMRPGQVRYSLVCNDEGGILDDVLIYRGYEAAGESFGMVVNASNREKIVRCLGGHSAAWQGELGPTEFLSVGDDTLPTAMIAVQGPKAIDLLKPIVRSMKDLSPFNLDGMGYYTCTTALLDEYGIMLSRTGYTGEDGFEIICEAEDALPIWEFIIERAEKVGGMACGLGARDTLRLEAAMPLYGHELNEETNPLEAGLGFAVNLEGRSFPGSEALAKVKRDKPTRARVGLELTGKRVPREHYGIFGGGTAESAREIGEVTSGTFSPTLQKPIAMGYVPQGFSAVGTEVLVDIRGAREPARVVKLPFYKRAS